VAQVLIVDDDPVVSLTLARMLEWGGHEVCRAESGQEGLIRARTEPPDAIILDMRMPAMNGLEFLKLLRTDQQFSSLPVGIVTGDYFLGEQVLDELSALGAEIRYKPVWIDDLTALMDCLIAEEPPLP
jgi:CheY-like chemotaxis protein